MGEEPIAPDPTRFPLATHPVGLGPADRVRVPTGFAVFANEFVSEGVPPREWAQRLYDVVRWTPMPRGGHFAAAEEPELLARDVAAFLADRHPAG